MTLYGTVDDVVADIVAVWDEVSRIPLGIVGTEPHRPRERAFRAPDVLTEIPPPEYVQALTGVEVPHHSTIRCPLPGHDDRTPSFKAYLEPERGWYCFGCHRGGTIYDFAAALWGMDTCGPEYLELRRELASALRRSVR